MFSSIEITCVSGSPRPVYPLHPQEHTSYQPLSSAPDFKRDTNRLEFAPFGGGEREGGQDTEGEKILVKRWFQGRKQLTQGHGLVWSAPQNPRAEEHRASGRVRSRASQCQTCRGALSTSPPCLLLPGGCVLLPPTQSSWQEVGLPSAALPQSSVRPRGNFLTAVPNAQERKADGLNLGPVHPSPGHLWPGGRYKINMA